MRRTFQWTPEIKLKRPMILLPNIFLGFEIFNPFGRRERGCVIPTIEFIPRFAIGIDRCSNYLGFKIAWLVVSFEIHQYFWVQIDKKRVKNEQEFVELNHKLEQKRYKRMYGKKKK